MAQARGRGAEKAVHMELGSGALLFQECQRDLAWGPSSWDDTTSPTGLVHILLSASEPLQAGPHPTASCVSSAVWGQPYISPPLNPVHPNDCSNALGLWTSLL